MTRTVVGVVLLLIGGWFFIASVRAESMAHPDSRLLFAAFEGGLGGTGCRVANGLRIAGTLLMIVGVLLLPYTLRWLLIAAVAVVLVAARLLLVRAHNRRLSPSRPH